MLEHRNRSEVETDKRFQLPAKGANDAFNLMENLHKEVAPDATPEPAALDAATATATEEMDTDAPEIFSSDDLAVLETRNEAPRELESAVRGLVTFSLDAPTYGAPKETPHFGRFSFCDYSKTAAHTRALFRMARAALDWLEADYLACEAEEMAHLRGELEAFEQMRGEAGAA